MVNRNCRATLRLLTLINRQGHPHPPLSSSPSGIDACWKQLQRNNVHGEHKIVSFFSPLASSLNTRQWGVKIQSRCYGSASVLVQRNPKFSKLNDEDVRYFEGILGAKNVIQDDEKLITANTDWMRKYKGSSKLLLQPRTTDQVSEILKYCNFRCLAVVPQGGNTGLVGGSVPVFDEVVVSLSAMSKIISFDKDNGEIEQDVNHRIQAGWSKWRSASGFICDKKMPLKLKGKFYRTAIRPAMLYGTECWAAKGEHEHKLSVAEMKMLRWMSGHTRLDKIRNEDIRERVGVAPIVEKMVESRLRWFGHVRRRPIEHPVRRVDEMEDGQRAKGRGRSKKTIHEVVKRDLHVNGLSVDMIHDRAQ